MGAGASATAPGHRGTQHPGLQHSGPAAHQRTGTRTILVQQARLDAASSGDISRQHSLKAQAPPPPPSVVTFDMAVLPDGRMLTTYTDDSSGRQFYMDWDALAWRDVSPQLLSVMPRSKTVMLDPVSAALGSFQNQSSFSDDLWDLPDPQETSETPFNKSSSGSNRNIKPENHSVSVKSTLKSLPADNWLQVTNTGSSSRQGCIHHPQLGIISTYIFEKKRNVRHYFDEYLGNWLVMPLSWEMLVPEVRNDVREIQSVLPQWDSVDEILLAMREHSYNVQDTINWKNDNSAKQISSRKSEKNQSEKVLLQKIRSLEEDLIANKRLLKDARKQLQESEENRIKLAAQMKSMNSGFLRQNTFMDSRVDNLECELKEERKRLEALELEYAKYRTNNSPTLAKELEELGSTMQKLMNDRNSLTKVEHQNAIKERDGIINRLNSEISSLKSSLHTNTSVSQPKIPLLISQKILSHFKQLRHELTKLQQDTQKMFAELTAELAEIVIASEEYSSNNRPLLAELEELRVKYRMEQLQRKLLFNQVQELKGNIRVYCRIRNDSRQPIIVGAPSQVEVAINSSTGRKIYDFDRVFSPSDTQEAVFADVKPLITSVLDGYNVCIMAYGQTGAGKTYTMMGSLDNPGVNRRAITELISFAKSKPETDVHFSVSMLEVYNENIIDLLAEPNSSKVPNVLSQVEGGRNIANLVEKPVCSEEEVVKTMKIGESNRSVASTKMNSTSSRSHLAVIVYISSVNRLSKLKTISKLTLVDLAGSERVAKSEAQGARLIEAAAINKSLSALGQVFSSLKQNSMHIPYRNSKLTHLLQDSLGGDSKTMVFVNISPLACNEQETSSTLTFGSAIRQVMSGSSIKQKEKKN